MASDGQIVFEVTADGKRAISDVRGITKSIQQETKKWDDAAEQSADKIGGSFSKTLTTIAKGFGALKVGKMLTDLGREAIEAASDLAEVQNVVDTTFGSGAGKIETWAKNAGTQFGLTETQAKRFTSTLGAMMKSSGIAGEEIVEMSTDLAGLAADMASFYNLDFDTAFQKIRSGISGETEPLKQLGINMSVANLEAFALEKGITKAFGAMTQGEQTALRYQYIMSATADAQGDFARTSDGYANSIRTLETNLTTLKTNLGGVLMDVVTPLVNGLNALFADNTGATTVLDDFAGIDAETERKLESIRTAAESAGILTDELDKLGGPSAKNAGSNLQKLAADLSGVKLDEGKAAAVAGFVSTLADNLTTLADIQGTDADGAKAWLDGIAASANALDPEDAAGWETLINTIKEGLPGIENTDFGASFFAALGGGFADVEGQASVLEWAVSSLGDKTSRTAEEQALWLETCKRLVKTIPGLSSIINTETGEVKGGTQAIRDYVKAWQDGQTKLAMLGALEQKEDAISQRFADLPGLQLDMAVAERRAREQQKKLQQLMDKYNLGEVGYFAQDDGSYKVARHWSDAYGMTDEDRKALDAAADELDKLEAESADAADAYKTQADALEEAKQALAEYRETIDEMPGTVEEAADASEKFWTDNAENITLVVNAAHDAVTALSDYAKGVQDAALAAVNSVAKSLDRVDFLTYGKQIENITKLTEKQAQYKVGSDEWKQLQSEIDKANDALISTDSIYKNLQSQADFLDTYLANLKQAREMGLSDALLAELSDGSIESAEYLNALVSGDGEQAKEVDALYQEVQGKKAALANELGNQQLTVDQTYQTLAEQAQAAVAALDLQGEAAENSGKTVAGIATGIASHLPDVTSAVDSILSELNRLSGYGISIDFGGFGKLNITTSTGATVEASGRMGIPFVPHDDYIARLHEGERVLTAQENQIWNALRNGGVSGFDLEQLGGVMRDNVKPGGNVYLDGRVVGSVISEIQGKSYRQLQRSGWQK